MPLPRGLARFNRAVTNRLARPVARHLPPLANVVHTGRTTGRVYRTPVLAFRHGRRVVIPLVYGADSDWVRNVLAADGCRLQRAGRLLVLTAPRRRTGSGALAVLPVLARPALRLVGPDGVLVLRPAR